MTDLKQAAQQALEAWQDQQGMKRLCEAMEALGTALEAPEQATGKESLQVEQPEQEPVKRWPFVETPEQFSNRLFEAIREFSSILPAVRHVLIENPPMFTHPPRREWRGLTEEEVEYPHPPAKPPVYATSQNTKAVRDGFEMGGYEKEPGYLGWAPLPKRPEWMR
jgi:hypothetical protein